MPSSVLITRANCLEKLGLCVYPKILMQTLYNVFSCGILRLRLMGRMQLPFTSSSSHRKEESLEMESNGTSPSF